MTDNITSPSEAELRRIFAEVIEKALADPARDEQLAGYDLTDAIPNITKLVYKPEFNEFKAVYLLLTWWEHAKSHGKDRIHLEPKIRVDQACELLKEVLDCYKSNSSISNPQILAFSKSLNEPKGCLFGLLNF